MGVTFIPKWSHVKENGKQEAWGPLHSASAMPVSRKVYV